MTVGGSTNRVYRKPGSDPNVPKFTCPTLKHPPSLMVWGSFGFGGVGELVILPANLKVNQHVYYELLNDVLESSFEMSGTLFWMQDGAPCHRAKSVTTWLKDCNIPFFEDWPGQSPDLNPIENLWAIMKRRLRNMDTSSLTKLEEGIKAVWESFPQEMLQRLSMSIPNRLNECIVKKGGPTKY